MPWFETLLSVFLLEARIAAGQEITVRSRYDHDAGFMAPRALHQSLLVVREARDQIPLLTWPAVIEYPLRQACARSETDDKSDSVPGDIGGCFENLLYGKQWPCSICHTIMTIRSLEMIVWNISPGVNFASQVKSATSPIRSTFHISKA